MIDFAGSGLGLRYGTVRVVRARAGWVPIADELVASVRSALSRLADDVQHVGSSAVAGLPAKPVLDLAIAVPARVQVDELVGPMVGLGWIYRGDAGDDGGWVFVMEDAPWHRVAHAHGVAAGGPQWRRYIEFRDLLRASAAARRTYGEAKRRLARRFPDDARRYTDAKRPTVEALLAGRA